jgi:predicted dehydrogenase
MNTRMHRRSFLRTASAAAAGVSLPYLIPSHVLGGPNKPGANERVNVGIIGLGGRAQDIANTCFAVPQVRLAAVCDCFAPRVHDFAKRIGRPQTWKTYEDFRRMIAKEKLDGVMVETTTHARAWIAILAMQAGMDAYIEKPMCLTIAEGRAMVNAARKYGRVTQVGTQQRSMPMNNWASDLLKSGTLGKCLTVIAPNFAGPIRWTKTSSKDVKGPVDAWWDIWTNQAELRPYDPQLHHGWGTWWDYDGGGNCFGVTGWGAHSYDQINRALGTDDTGPCEVILEEPVANRRTGKFGKRQSVGGVILGDTGDIDTGTDYHHMADITGPRAKVTMKFAGGTELKLHLDGDRGPGLGAIFVCEKGKIEINRDKIASNPKEIVHSPANPGHNKRPETAYHVENWAECIKTRKRANADIEIGQRATTLCYLVNIVRDVGQVGKALKWDPVAERFTNCDEANKFLTRPRRKGYELPEIG